MPGKYRGISPFSCVSRKFLAFLLIACPVIAASPMPASAKERRAEVTYSVNLNAPADAIYVRLWIPYPMSDENQQDRWGK
jgi:hypothetical protein